MTPFEEELVRKAVEKRMRRKGAADDIINEVRAGLHHMNACSICGCQYSGDGENCHDMGAHAAYSALRKKA